MKTRREFFKSAAVIGALSATGLPLRVTSHAKAMPAAVSAPLGSVALAVNDAVAPSKAPTVPGVSVAVGATLSTKIVAEAVVETARSLSVAVTFTS